MTMGALACALTLNAHAPKGPFEQGLTEPVVLRTDNVVFRQIEIPYRMVMPSIRPHTKTGHNVL